MTRTRAALLHLCLSAAVVGAFLAITWFVWYPPPLAQAMGVGHIAVILVGVDVVLGPCLTFVVFSQAKRTLVFDLCVIATIQLTAFAIGVHTVFVSRPVYAVFAVDRIELTSASQIDAGELAKVIDPRFQSIPILGPCIVGARLPKDHKERQRILFSSLDGADLHVFPQHFVPYEVVRGEVLRAAKPLAALPVESDRRAVGSLLQKRNISSTNVRFLPVAARKRDVALLVDARSATPIEFVDVQPW